MQISRDLTERPGVGTLMYMGQDEALAAQPTSTGARIAAGVIGALAIRYSLHMTKQDSGIAGAAAGIGGAYALLKAITG